LVMSMRSSVLPRRSCALAATIMGRPHLTPSCRS
jgi:hypothetical protein